MKYTAHRRNQIKKLYNERRQFTFKAGETRYFACNIDYEKNIGAMFGLVGALATKYLGRSYIDEKGGRDPDSLVVTYYKMN